MGDFSGTVKVANVSDFIAPAQSCIIGLDSRKKEESETSTSQVVCCWLLSSEYSFCDGLELLRRKDIFEIRDGLGMD